MEYENIANYTKEQISLYVNKLSKHLNDLLIKNKEEFPDIKPVINKELIILEIENSFIGLNDSLNKMKDIFTKYRYHKFLIKKDIHILDFPISNLSNYITRLEKTIEILKNELKENK